MAFSLSCRAFQVRYISCHFTSAPKDQGEQDMEIHTKRFGVLNVANEDVLHFPNGLIGFEDCHRWVLLCDPRNELVVWLQSVEQADLALAVVSPRRFVRNYRARVSRWELEPICLRDSRCAEVLVVVGKGPEGVALNLKAPVVLNLECRLGCQAIANGELPVRYALGDDEYSLRRTA